MNEQNDKLEAEKIVVESKLLKWLDNFWYHHKWHTIFAAFFVIVFGICLVQCATVERSEVMITYAGNYTLSVSESEEIGNLFTSLLPTDKNNVHSTTAGINRFSIYNEEELKLRNTDPETGEYTNTGYWASKATNDDNMSGFSSYVMTGESCIWLVSPYVYEELVQMDRLVTLESLGVAAEYGADACAVRLADTAFYQYYELLQKLPEDTLLVLAKKTVVGSTSKEDAYNLNKQLFLDILNFEPS